MFVKNTIFIVLCSAIALEPFATATMVCRECVPFEDLVAHTYGISISRDGRMDSVIYYHDRTHEFTETIWPSPGLTEVLNSWAKEPSSTPQVELSDLVWYKSKRRMIPVPGAKHPKPLISFPKPLISFLPSFIRTIFEPTSAPPVSLPALTTDAAMFYDSFVKLQSRNTQTGLPMNYVGILVPPFVNDAQASHIILAAMHANLTVVDIHRSTTRAVAAAYGEICPSFDSDYFECPCNLFMTLDVTSDSKVHAELVQNDGCRHTTTYDSPPLVGPSPNFFRRLLGANPRAVIDPNLLENWVRNVTATSTEKRLFMTGALLRTQSELQEAVQRAVPKWKIEIDDYSGKVLELGAAILAKQEVDSQDSDCVEDDFCVEIAAEVQKASRPLKQCA